MFALYDINGYIKHHWNQTPIKETTNYHLKCVRCGDLKFLEGNGR
jgi:hypothetical protein